MASVPAALGIAGELGKSVISSQLLTEIFKWVTARPEAKERARPKIIALYKDLLQLQSGRNALMDRLKVRVTELEEDRDSKATRDGVTNGARTMNRLLQKFEKDCRSLAVALDQGSPAFGKNRRSYVGEQAAAVQPLQVTMIDALLRTLKQSKAPSEGLAQKEVKTAYDRLLANTKNFNNLISDYRRFVNQNYPNALDLVD